MCSISIQYDIPTSNVSYHREYTKNDSERRRSNFLVIMVIKHFNNNINILTKYVTRMYLFLVFSDYF